MIYFRVDASKEIATGHLMRTMSIAKALQKMGETSIFIVADEYSVELLRKNNWPYIKLNCGYNCLEEELPQLLSIIKINKIEQLFIDSYAVNNDFLEAINEQTRVIYLDDFAKNIIFADTVINYNISAQQEIYQSLYSTQKFGEKTQFLIGPKYAPLRDEFSCAEQKKISDNIHNILITTGGTDQFNVAYEFANQFISYGDRFQVDIVTGGINPNLPMLKRLEENEEKVFLHINCNYMSRLMKQADLCISAGGSTLYELCAIGTPTISFSVADNQLENVKNFHVKGIIPYAGDVRAEYDGVVNCKLNIKAWFEKWLDNKRERQFISKQMQCLVDGGGAMRVANFLMNN